MATKIIRAAIESIRELHPGLYVEHHVVMTVAVLRRICPAPCDLHVSCEGFCPAPLSDPKFVLRVHWRRATEKLAEKMLQSEQRVPIIERAAVGVSALLIGTLVPDGQMIVTVHGDRADYWLPRKRYAVEISGTERKDALTARSPQEKTSVRQSAWLGRVRDGLLFRQASTEDCLDGGP
jgi:hypothetical protein